MINDSSIIVDVRQVEKAGEVLPLREEQEVVPKVLEEWLQAPYVTAGLGFKIAKELYMRGWMGGD